MGLDIFETELGEQILNDGGHFELSTMYHSIIFEDIIDVCNMFECFKFRLGQNQLGCKNLFR